MVLLTQCVMRRESQLGLVGPRQGRTASAAERPSILRRPAASAASPRWRGPSGGEQGAVMHACCRLPGSFSYVVAIAIMEPGTSLVPHLPVTSLDDKRVSTKPTVASVSSWRCAQMLETSLKRRYPKRGRTLQQLRAASLARWKIHAGLPPFQSGMIFGSTALTLVGIGGMPPLARP